LLSRPPLELLVACCQPPRDSISAAIPLSQGRGLCGLEFPHGPTVRSSSRYHHRSGISRPSRPIGNPLSSGIQRAWAPLTEPSPPRDARVRLPRQSRFQLSLDRSPSGSGPKGGSDGVAEELSPGLPRTFLKTCRALRDSRFSDRVWGSHSSRYRRDAGLLA
jgi:hypothetical protein